MPVLEHAELRRVLGESASLVAATYVFEDVALALAELLRERTESGAYDEAADLDELAQLVTADLQSVNGDRHLRLIHHVQAQDLEAEDSTRAWLTTKAQLTLGGIAAIRSLEHGAALLELAPILFPLELAADSLVAAMNLVAPASGLLLDVRNLVGGSPPSVAFVCSYFFEGPVHLISTSERESVVAAQSWTLPFVPGPRFGAAKPIVVLTSGTTFSGGEELAFDLQQHGRALVVGERTGGGAHPREGFPVHPHLELTIPVARSFHPVTETDWEGTGVVPDIEAAAADAFDVGLAELLRRL